MHADERRFSAKPDRLIRAYLRLILFFFALAPLLAQNAELSGLITDPSGLAVPGARVVVQSADTGATRTVSSNQQGEYSVPALLPGPYNITVEANGFKTIHQNGVVVEVDQRARLDFALTVGSNTESVTVRGSAPLLNTSDASVSTVIGNQFVENLPLNGRSFSSLIDLTPGVVLTPANFYEQGQFSVNGQRPDANYFMVDGVSANLGTAGSGANLGQGGAGQLPATSAFGGTSNLVSLDALRRVPHSDFDLCAGIRAYSRRSNIGGHQVRHEHFSRHGVRILPQRQAGCQRLVRQRQRSGEARTAAERFRRRAGRADHQRQAVLLRLLRGAEGAPASGCGYVRAVVGLAPECARSRPAVAQCLPVTERAGPR